MANRSAVVSMLILAIFLAAPAYCAEPKEELSLPSPSAIIKAVESSVASKEPARSFTLKDAIEAALINNKTIQIQKQEVEFARAGILYARSAFLPVVNVGYDYTLNDAVASTAGISGQRKDPGVFTGYKNDNLVKLSLNETIYNGGANISSLEQAKLNLKVQQETLRAARLDIEFETKRLYYGLLLAYETRRIAFDLVEQARAHYDETRMRFEHGTASTFDVLQSKTQISRLVPQLVNAEAAIELIKAELKKLLSFDMRRDISLDGHLGYSQIEIREIDYLAEAYGNKPEMKLKLLGIDIQKWAIEYARAGWLPQITAGANYQVRSNDVGNMFNPRHDNWSVGASASIALFDGFATKAKVDEAKAKYSRAGLEKEDVVEKIAVDIKNACLDLEKARGIIDAEKDSVVDAKEALRLSEVRFTNGVGINLDVLDSQVALAQVETALAQGIYDYTMARAQLYRTMGREYTKEGA